MELKEYWTILLRRRWVVVQAFLVIVAISVLLSFLVPPLYQAQSKLLVQRKPSEMRMFEGLLQDLGQTAEYSLETHLSLILTRPVIEQMISKLNLRGKDGRLLDPQNLLPPKGLSVKSFLPGAIRQVQATELPDTNLIQISAFSPKPKEAAAMANTLAAIYVQESERRNQSMARSAREFVQRQLGAAQQRLYTTQEALIRFKKQSQTLNLDKETELALEKMASLLTELEETNKEIQEARDHLRAATSQLKKLSPMHRSSVTEVDNPHIQDLKSKLLDLETRRFGLLERYNETHPQVREVDRQIEEVRKRLSQEVQRIFGSETRSLNPIYQEFEKQAKQAQVDLFISEGKRRVIENLVQKYEAQLRTLPDKELQLARLTLDAQTARDAYRMLKERWYDLIIRENMRVANVEIVEPAVVPLRPVRPNKPVNIVLGVLVGLMLGVLMAFMVDYLDDTVRSPDSVRSWANLPVLAVVPRFPKGRGPLISSFGSRSHVTEAYRTLRYNISLSQPDRPPRIVLVTSALPKEGKTVTAANLALVLAGSGKRVLLLEGDLRKPQLRELFSTANHKGLTNFLTDAVPLQEVVERVPTGQGTRDKGQGSDDGSLDLLCSGLTPPDPVRLLESQKMKELLQEVGRRYDAVIIDTPPIIPVNDANLIAPLVDGVVVVVRAGVSNRRSLKVLSEVCERSNLKVLGCVVNAFTPTTKDEFYHGYAYGYDEQRTKLTVNEH